MDALSTTLRELSQLRISDQVLHIPPTAEVCSANSGGKRVYGAMAPGAYCVVRRTSQLTRSRLAKHFALDHLIRVWFEWDYLLDGYGKTEEIFRAFLKTEWDAGIRIAAQFDFSVWFWEPEEKRLGAILRNFQYMKIAQEMGFLTLLNFNNILIKYRNIYREILPKNVGTIVIDANHSEKAYARVESLALDALFTDFDVKTAIIITGRTVPNELDYLAAPCRAAGVRIVISPPEVYWMRFAIKPIKSLPHDAHREPEAPPVSL